MLEVIKMQRHLTYLYPESEHEVELPLPDNAFRTEKNRFVFNPKAVRQPKGCDYDYYGRRTLVKIWEDLCKKVSRLHRNQDQHKHTFVSWISTYLNVNVPTLLNR